MCCESCSSSGMERAGEGDSFLSLQEFQSGAEEAPLEVLWFFPGCFIAVGGQEREQGLFSGL